MNITSCVAMSQYIQNGYRCTMSHIEKDVSLTLFFLPLLMGLFALEVVLTVVCMGA